MSGSESDKVDLLVGIAELLIADRQQDGGRRPREILGYNDEFRFLDIADRVKTDLSRDTFRRFMHELVEKDLLEHTAGGGRRIPLVYRVKDWHRMEEVQDPTAASELLYPIKLTPFPQESVEELPSENELNEPPEEVDPTTPAAEDELGKYFMQLIESVKAVEGAVKGMDARLSAVEKRVESLGSEVFQRCEQVESHHQESVHAQELRSKALAKSIEDAALIVMESVKDIKPLPLQEFSERVEKAMTFPIEGKVAEVLKRMETSDNKIQFLLNRIEKSDEKREKIAERREKSDRVREELNAWRDSTLNSLLTAFGEWTKKTLELSSVVANATDLGAIIETGWQVKEFMKRIDGVRVGGLVYSKKETRGARAAVPDHEPEPNLMIAVYDPTK